MTLQELFQEIRKHKELSQQQLADALNLSIKSVSSIETGKTNNLKSSTLSAIANFLGISELLLIKVLNNEIECKWDDLQRLKVNLNVFSAEDDQRIHRFIDSCDKVYDLYIKGDKNETFYFTTSRRDHRNIILLLPYSSFETEKIVSNDQLIGSLLVKGTQGQTYSSFRNIWVIFEDTLIAEQAAYNTFSLGQNISLSSVNIEYVLFNSLSGEIVESKKMTL